MRSPEPVDSVRELEITTGGDVAETVDQLKAQPGGDMIAYGGGTLVSDLIAKGRLDELHLFVNPTAIGAGMPVFPNVGAYQQLRLVAAQRFDCGITGLHLEPKRSWTRPATAETTHPVLYRPSLCWQSAQSARSPASRTFLTTGAGLALGAATRCCL